MLAMSGVDKSEQCDTLQAPLGLWACNVFVKNHKEWSSFEDTAVISPDLRFTHAYKSSLQKFSTDSSSDPSRVCVQIGNPEHPVTMRGFGLDPELLEVSVLAALQRTGRDTINMLQLPGRNADSLVSKELIAKIRELTAEGLIQHWGIHARTVKQAMRAMSFLGLDYVSLSATDLGLDAIPGILRAADRAKMPMLVSVNAQTATETITEIRRHPNVLAVLIEIRTDQDLDRARKTLGESTPGKADGSVSKIA